MTAHVANRLTTLTVKNAATGKHADGQGLWLHQREGGRGQWVFRFTLHGKRHEMGLGSSEVVSLKEAREMTADARRAVARGVNPIRQRELERLETRRGLRNLAEIAQDAFESRKASLKGDGAAGRWLSSLTLHVLPKLGSLPVGEITQLDIRETLLPIWRSKAPTAKKALSRLGICIEHAAALGLNVDMQVTDKARALLGPQMHKAKPHSAMPWRKVPAFFASLDDGSITHLALRFLILTGLRSAPVRYLRLDQIDGNVLTIPGERMKGKRGATPDFRVPLPPEALEIIEQAKPLARRGYLFPNSKGGVIGDNTMSGYMEDRGLEARPHGFRSSLRDWLAETCNLSHEAAESCLAHYVDNRTVRSYRRTDFLEQREVVMARWARHVTGRSGDVIIGLLREA